MILPSDCGVVELMKYGVVVSLSNPRPPREMKEKVDELELHISCL